MFTTYVDLSQCLQRDMIRRLTKRVVILGWVHFMIYKMLYLFVLLI